MPGYCAASKLAAPPFIVLYAPACNIFRFFEHCKLLTGSFPHIHRCSAYAWFLFLLSVSDVWDKLCVHTLFVFMNAVEPLVSVCVGTT